MRFAPAFFIPAAFALASCSSPVPSTPDAAWIVNMTGGSGGTVCTQGDSMIPFGDSDVIADAIYTRVTQGEVVKSAGAPNGQTASVVCAVIPLSGGAFEVQAQTTLGADALTVTIPSINTGATMATPAVGNVTYVSSVTADTPYAGMCNFYFVPSTIESVASGKFFSAFACTGLVDAQSNPASTCPVVESYFAVEDCETTPIF